MVPAARSAGVVSSVTHRAGCHHRELAGAVASQGWLSPFPAGPGMQLRGLATLSGGVSSYTDLAEPPGGSRWLRGARGWRRGSRLKGSRQLPACPRAPFPCRASDWHRGQRLYLGRNEEHDVLEGESGIICNIYGTKIKKGMQCGAGRLGAAPVAQPHVGWFVQFISWCEL